MTDADSLVIEGGRLLDPSAGLDGPRDLLVRDGLIEAVERPGALREVREAERLDAAGCWVVPGLVDIHTHLREPGHEHKETIASGVEAAVAGGFTAVACMANTEPVNDSGAVTRLILELASRAGKARVYPVGALSVGLRGERLAEIGEMREAGIVAVSDDGHPVMDAALMRRALEYCTQFAIPVLDHAEDRSLSCGGCMNEGPVSLRLGLRGIPSAAEDVMVGRDIALAELTGGRLHVCHVSTRGAVARVREAKARGVRVTAEAAPHHFSLTEEAVRDYDTNAKMNPPLRAAADVEALREGLADGTIEAIATDHAPHHRDEKDQEFDHAPFGIVGLETALPLALGLVREGVLAPLELIRRLSTGPAALLGVAGGSLARGVPADVTLIDPEREWTVDPSLFRSRSRNTPFAGGSMRGRTRATIVGGRVVYREEPVE